MPADDRGAAGADPRGLHWQSCRIALEATSAPRRAHPLSVLEAVIKGAREAAAITPPLLWHQPGRMVEGMDYRPGERIELELQLFSADAEPTERLSAALHDRLASEQAGQRHFVLREALPWQSPLLPAYPPAPAWRLDFYTPLPLPKKGHVTRTAVSPEEFLFACRKRVGKLWGVAPHLPSAPTIEPLGWRYWRTTHRSRSQSGEPLLLNGCLGQLRLSGESLDDWLPWLSLFAEVGMGERLGFSLGRFTLLAEAAPAVAAAALGGLPEPLRHPLYVERAGCKLSLDNENIVLEGIATADVPADKARYPIRLLESVQCGAAVQITTALCHALGEHGVPLIVGQPGTMPLVLASAQSEFRHHRRLVAHHRAHEALDDAQRGRLAARWVRAKLEAQARLIRGRYQAGDDALLGEIDRAVAALQRCDNVDAARGWEGLLARQYYPWLAARHPALGEWRGRVRQTGSPDALNALLNYGYALLRARAELAVRAQGLDPFLGILHAANGRHTALVSDFMEPLRAHVERLLLRLLGLGQIRPEHLEESAHGIYLAPAARRAYVQAFARIARGAGKAGLIGELEALTRGFGEAVVNDRLAEWQPPMSSSDEAPTDG